MINKNVISEQWKWHWLASAGPENHCKASVHVIKNWSGQVSCHIDISCNTKYLIHYLEMYYDLPSIVTGMVRSGLPSGEERRWQLRYSSPLRRPHGSGKQKYTR